MRTAVLTNYTVVVADDHEIVRIGLRQLLLDTPFEIVREVADGVDAISAVESIRPNILISDVRLPKLDGLDAQERIRDFSETQTVFLTAYSSPTYLARAVALGAADYVNKNSSREELVDRLTRIAEGRGCPDNCVLGRFRREMGRRPVPDANSSLTARETQVLRHVAMGLSNREIGFALGISVETVKEHVQNILRKSGCTDRTQAAVWSVRNGLVQDLEVTWPMNG